MLQPFPCVWLLPFFLPPKPDLRLISNPNQKKRLSPHCPAWNEDAIKTLLRNGQLGGHFVEVLDTLNNFCQRVRRLMFMLDDEQRFQALAMHLF